MGHDPGKARCLHDNVMAIVDHGRDKLDRVLRAMPRA